MPPRATRAKAEKPLKGYHIVLAVTQVPAGILRGQKSSWVSSEVKRLGGKTGGAVGSNLGVTHVVATDEQYQNREGRVDAAIATPDVKIVTYDWLDQILHLEKPVDEDKYLLHDRSVTVNASPTAAPQIVVTNQTKTTKAKKRGRSAAVTDQEKDEDEADQPTKKQIKAEVPDKTEPKDGQLATSASLVVPLDDGAPSNAKVFVGDDGMIYDATLNQTNSGHNNNKFYRIQLLKDSANNFHCWTRWGRVGERGQSKLMLGPSFEAAFKDFNKKFKDKNGNQWDNRFGETRAGKYTFLERNYEPDSEDEETKDKTAQSKEDEAGAQIKEEEVESKLPEPVQRLMGLIFNQVYFQQTFAQLNYDAQKMPLGKLSKRTLLRGYDVLKELANLVASPTATGNVPEKSNQYFSLIPHAFGRDRPPILNSMDMIKREIELLDTLTDMSLANDIIKEAKKNKEDEEKLHLFDRQYGGLKMKEMTPLDPKSTEYKQLEAYLIKSAGQTHRISYQIEDIFRIERDGEHDRFSTSKYAKYAKSDRRLLWHGSRCTNFGGILSQGLRIAPPEAPVSGYMFGKGVYLADMSTKSANYCNASASGNVGLLLLCEAELGKPPLKLVHADFNAGERAIKEGSISTWGVGMTAPQKWQDAGRVHKSLKGVQMPDVQSKEAGATNEAGAGLMYNEYIAYDVAQIRLRYLFRVVMR